MEGVCVEQSKGSSLENLHYLKMLAKQYPTVQAASTEIINLQAILDLPKGTEHFLSDVHGEYEAFQHILNSASGVVREKLDDLFGASLSQADRDQLATLIYYPKEKLEEIARETADMGEWYRITFHRLIEVCRLVSSKYTRSKVRKAMPQEYAYIIDEMLHTHYEDSAKRDYYENIIHTIIRIDRAADFLVELCGLIKRMAVDHLHLVGDIFDRGPGADIILDSLMDYHSVDIQWGNHDILWMGAASGSRTLVATVLANSLRYDNLDVIETGYGISLRPLSVFADEVYRDSDVGQFAVKIDSKDEPHHTEKSRLQAARMYKAITILLFKLEGQKILRNPSFGMQDRLLLDKIDYSNKRVCIDGVDYPLTDTDFPTVDPKDPYALTPEEERLISQLTRSFLHSEKLQRHVRFLYSKGSIYRVYNGNLLFHGCIPMTEDGQLMRFSIGCKDLAGKEFLDYADLTARRAYYSKPGSAEREFGMDFLWFLWAGRNSPVFGRDRMTTFERRLIRDERTWAEPKNAYYRLCNDPEVCQELLRQFGLEGPHCHIINGHVPVKSKKGESPIKGGGRLLVIDGGFSRAYQETTGIAGYTLIYNSACLRLVSHEPFAGRESAIRGDRDIASSSVIFERLEHRMKIAETDVGRQLKEQIGDLMDLLAAYRSGAIVEDHRAASRPAGQ
ncbi:MAG TPA: fructose-1,6-bisphosphatase [Candidatus Enterenecus merdae]|nr:fructose-1,6-bisphosphatase [Candidatus Enterenecus merdae]